MIVARYRQALRLVTQPDHARLASEMLSLWRHEGLPEHPRRRELLLAAREHDNGWGEIDSAPYRRDDGRPHDFLSLPAAPRRELWRRGVRRLAGREPYAALLILRHARRLHRSHRDDPEWEEIFREWDELDETLREVTDASEEALERDDRWIDLTDRLSLAVCNRWPDAGSHRGYRSRFDPETETLFLDPFPLAGRTTLTFPCRLIPDRRYESVVDLGTELATARWQDHRVGLDRWPPPDADGV